MPPPIPVPIRQAIFRLWPQGCGTRQIVASTGLPSPTVRRLLRRFRHRGRDGILPDYRGPAATAAEPPEVVQAAVRPRRDHPTWGAGLIRVPLLREAPGRPAPSERTLQRWFVRADLSPAPAGRPPRVDPDRATSPHQTWQMDAKEHIRLYNSDEVSWLRLIDECSGAVLWTAAFPPRDLGPSRPRGRPRAAPPGLRPLGAARPLPRRQRLALGGPGRLPHRVGAVADRPGRRDALEPRAATAGGRGRRAVPGDLGAVVRAVDLPIGRGAAGPPGGDGPLGPRGRPLPGRSESPRGRPGPGAFRPAIRSGIGGGGVAVVARGRAPGGDRAVAAGRSEWPGLGVQPEPLGGEAPSREGRLCDV
jgi:hypothetical protein